MSALKSPLAVPPGGFSVNIRGVHFAEQTYDALVNAVEMYQRSNNTSWGDSEALVDTELCARWPDGCFSGPSGVSPNLMEAAKRALQTLLRCGDRRASQDEAERRARICANCHNNHDAATGNATSGCKSCGSGARFFSSALWRFADKLFEPVRNAFLSGRTTSVDNRLGVCGICGCPNRVIVWVPTDAFDYSVQEKLAYPSFCWKKD